MDFEGRLRPMVRTSSLFLAVLAAAVLGLVLWTLGVGGGLGSEVHGGVRVGDLLALDLVGPSPEMRTSFAWGRGARLSP